MSLSIAAQIRLYFGANIANDIGESNPLLNLISRLDPGLDEGEIDTFYGGIVNVVDSSTPTTLNLTDGSLKQDGLAQVFEGIVFFAAVSMSTVSRFGIGGGTNAWNTLYSSMIYLPPSQDLVNNRSFFASRAQGDTIYTVTTGSIDRVRFAIDTGSNQKCGVFIAGRSDLTP